MLNRLTARAIIACLVFFFIVWGITGSMITGAFGGLIIALAIKGLSAVSNIFIMFLGTMGKYGMLSIMFRSIWGFVIILVLLLFGSWILIIISCCIGAGRFFRDILEAVRFDKALTENPQTTEFWKF